MDVERMSEAELRDEIARRRRNFSPALGQVRIYHNLIDALANRTGVDVYDLRNQLWLDGKTDEERAEAIVDAAHWAQHGTLAPTRVDIDALRVAWRARMRDLPLIRTLEADCPWRFAGNRRRGGAGRHYKLMTTAELCRYPIPPIDKDCRLALWRVGAMQQDALDVSKAWGFTQKAEIVWVKTTQDGLPLLIDQHGRVITDPKRVLLDGKKPKLNNLHFGMGHQFRYAHETCLISTRGNPVRLSHHRTVFFAPAPRDTAGKLIHSGKPSLFYEILADMSPGPRYSLFSRDEREGWMVDGDESPNAVTLD